MMMTRALSIIVFSIAFLFYLSSCGNPGGTNSSNNVPGFDGPNNNNNNVSSGNTSGGACANKWGGVTCLSGSNQDQNFLNFISNGTYIGSDIKKKGVGDISCAPRNSGGILIKMNVLLNGQFNPNGQNNNLVMQPSSTFEFTLYDSKAIQQKLKPISAKFEGLSGEVNGNQADLSFTYNGGGENGTKNVRLKGTFDADVFSGTISFDNEKLLLGPDQWTTPGRSGQLGNFKIATCSVFKSK